MNYNVTKWMLMVLQAFLNTGEDFLKTINGTVDVKENEKVVVPVFDIPESAIQEDGAGTVFVNPDKTVVEIPTKDEIKLGVSFKRKDELSTNTNLFNLSAKRMGQIIRKRLAYNVVTAMFTGVKTANKLQYDEADGGTGVTVLTYNMVLKASELLDMADCPLEDRYMIISPSQRKELVNMRDDADNPVFINNAQLDDKIIYKGQIGEVDGMKVLIMKIPKLNTSGLPTGTQDKNAVIFYHKSAHVYGAEKKIFSEDGFNRVTTEFELLNQLFYGSKTIFESHSVSIRENT